MKPISLDVQLTPSPSLQLMRVSSPYVEFVHLGSRCGLVDETPLFCIVDELLPLFFERKQFCLSRGQHLMLRRGWYNNKSGNCHFDVELIYGGDALPPSLGQSDADYLIEDVERNIARQEGYCAPLSLALTLTKADFGSDYFTLFADDSYAPKPQLTTPEKVLTIEIGEDFGDTEPDGWIDPFLD